MYIYKDKNMCTGCTACSNICSRHAVSMRSDEKGFLYPEVDMSLCAKCGLCTAVCHTYEEEKKCYEEHAFYYINEDRDILQQSSSGGAFSYIAQCVLEQNGWISGAVFDEQLKVVHILSNDANDVLQMRGSKYAQSDLNLVFSNVKELLTNGKVVLFTGSPCQVIGLKKYLRKDYDNLICVDIICHSTPSPLIFEKYLEMKEEEIGTIQSISFRDKRDGWEDYSICFETNNGKVYENHKHNLYMCGFTGDLYSRECCTHCPAKERTGYWSDITIGDFWGAQELISEQDCSNGVSLIITHTEKGLNMVRDANMTAIPLEVAVANNPRYKTSHIRNKDSRIFWKIFQRKGIRYAYKHIYEPSMQRKTKLKLNLLVSKLLGNNYKK